jgi:hypothetical protein
MTIRNAERHCGEEPSSTRPELDRYRKLGNIAERNRSGVYVGQLVMAMS